MKPKKLSLLIFLMLFFGVVLAFGQNERGNQSKFEIPESIKESLEKRRIKQEEKDFLDLIERSEEAVKISEELNKSFTENNKLSSEDIKKLEKLEKVVKKIRRDLGAEDEKEEKFENKLETLSNTLTILKEKAADLVAELKKTGRFAISVVAVESSNAIFRLVKFLRINKN